MLSAPPGKIVSFADIALRRPYLWSFIALMLLAVIGIAGSAVIGPGQPPGYGGTAQDIDLPIEVPTDAEPPLRLQVSHKFLLITTAGSASYWVDDGVDEIPYTVTVDNEAGDEVGRESSRLDAPLRHTFSRGDTEDTVKVTNSHSFSLRPGKYVVTLDSDHPLDYSISQTSSSFWGGAMLMGIGLLAIVLMFGLALFVFYKRDTLRRSQMAGASGPGLAPPAPYIPAPASGFKGPAAASPPPAPAYLGSPSPGSAGRSSLEYVPGGFYAEVQCSYCGSSIRNAPVNGMITCDRCGQTGRLY